MELGERLNPRGCRAWGANAVPVEACGGKGFAPLPGQQLLLVLQELPLQLCVAGSVWEAAQPPEGPCAN